MIHSISVRRPKYLLLHCQFSRRKGIRGETHFGVCKRKVCCKMYMNKDVKRGYNEYLRLDEGEGKNGMMDVALLVMEAGET